MFVGHGFGGVIIKEVRADAQFHGFALITNEKNQALWVASNDSQYIGIAASTCEVVGLSISHEAVKV